MMELAGLRECCRTLRTPAIMQSWPGHRNLGYLRSGLAECALSIIATTVITVVEPHMLRHSLRRADFEALFDKLLNIHVVGLIVTPGFEFRDSQRLIDL